MTPSDETFLDELFERLSAAEAEGSELDLERELAGREHLAERAVELRALARRLRKSRDHTALVPDVPGFEVLRELGRGSMAVVYLAREEALGGRPVALKVLSTSLVASDRERSRFQSEVRALARVRHPNVVAVHGVHLTDRLQAFSMEWVEGVSLAGLVRQRAQLAEEARTASGGGLEQLAALSAARWVPYVCRTGVALARALAAVHAAGLLHRDVKPSNVLLREDGSPLLSDFGLVRDPEASLHTETGAFLGTLAYAAPEQIRGEPLDPRADVYGLGATLYRALTLRLPVEGSSHVEVLRRLEAGAVAPLRVVDPRLSRDLETIVEKALDPEPGRRYASADAFGDDLQRLLDLQPIRARRVGPVGRVWRWGRRNRTGVRWSAASLLLALVVVLVGVRQSAHAREVEERADAWTADARLALLDTRLDERMRIASKFGITVLQRPLRESAERALASYARALELRPDSEAAVLEHAVVDHGLRWLRGEPVSVEPGSLFAERCPTTAAALRSPVALAAPADWSALGRDDRRALGMLAYLAGSLELAASAWEGVEGTAGDEPLLAGLLGQAYLVSGRPERAYPRLWDASQALAGHGFLSLMAADAAVQCGDLAMAERLFEAARDARPAPPEHDLRRVEARWHERSGRLEEAKAAYAGVPGYGLYRLRADEAAAAGDLAVACGIYGDLVQLVPGDVGAKREFLRLARGWWGAFSPEDHATLLSNGLRDLGVPVGGTVYGFLHNVDRVRHELGAPEDGQASALDSLAARIDWGRVDLERCAELDGPVRTELVRRWLDPDGSADELLRANACLRDEARSYFDGAVPAIAEPLRAVAPLDTYETFYLEFMSRSHAMVGDLDGDGVTDFLVYSSAAEGAGTIRGCVRAHSGRTGERLYAIEGDEDFDTFGRALAHVGDVDGDGVSDWIAGAPQDELSGPGYARICSGVDGASLARFEGGNARDQFGLSVAGLGDVDGDGTPDVAVGAPQESGGEGRVHVLSGRGHTLDVLAGRGGVDHFGTRVTNVGDLDGDGVCELAVATERYGDGGSYVLVLSGRDRSIVHELGGGGDDLGPMAVARWAGDVDGDGVADLALGLQPTSDPGRFGSVRVVSGATGATLFERRGAHTLAGFGSHAAGLGDLDGDGRAEIAVASWNPRSLRGPRVDVVTSAGEPAWSAPGWYRLHRLGADPLLPAAPEPPRFVASGLGSWSRYSGARLGGVGTLALVELARR